MVSQSLCQPLSLSVSLSPYALPSQEQHLLNSAVMNEGVRVSEGGLCHHPAYQLPLLHLHELNSDPFNPLHTSAHTHTHKTLLINYIIFTHGPSNLKSPFTIPIIV